MTATDYTVAAALLDDLPKAQWLLGERGYNAGWFRDALEAKGIQLCIPGRRSRHEPVRYDKRRYRRSSRIENMFGRLKDWRRVATCYDRCPTAFFSAGALAATRGGPGCLNRLAVWISRSPLVDHAAARSGWPKYTWSGVLAPRAECGRTLL
jgi:transposase